MIGGSPAAACRNENAVTASFVELTLTTGENVVLDFSFALDNTTDHDYTLPNEKDSLYVETPRGKGLYQYNNSPDPYLQNVTIDSSVILSKEAYPVVPGCSTFSV